jgi:maltose alpha-D-glucosyltransferase/alpha-amylase
MLENAGSHPALGSKIRTHGDLHLGQILMAPEDVWIIDFEGEPSRTLEENRRKHSPLRDVAGMLRSFHYAYGMASRATQSAEGKPSSPTMPALALDKLFLTAYHGVNPVFKLLPSAEEDRESLLNLFTLEKMIYEALYEFNNRPDWAEIPLQDLAALVN